MQGVAAWGMCSTFCKGYGISMRNFPRSVFLDTVVEDAGENGLWVREENIWTNIHYNHLRRWRWPHLAAPSLRLVYCGDCWWGKRYLRRVPPSSSPAQRSSGIGGTAAQTVTVQMEALVLVVPSHPFRRSSGPWPCGLIEGHATSGRRGLEAPQRMLHRRSQPILWKLHRVCMTVWCEVCALTYLRYASPDFKLFINCAYVHHLLFSTGANVCLLQYVGEMRYRNAHWFVPARKRDLCCANWLKLPPMMTACHLVSAHMKKGQTMKKTEMIVFKGTQFHYIITRVI